MAVTVILSTLPGSLTLEDRCTSKTIEMFGKCLGNETLPEIRNVADIKVAVAVFGARIRERYPDTSFYVTVSLARGCRKPGGYDSAIRASGFGQDDFLHIVDRRTKPAEAA